ncbi:MAG TPA: Omp28-related outer membrane protein [Bacteroidetes bacterium]|nr:Omp28-related outer membrane protein [Bacteroidota bacterium]
MLMKKLIFTIAATFTFFGLFAQIDRELVLVEITTGTWCPNCPAAARGADDLHANGDPVAIIENHGPMGSDAYANTYSVARNSYYGNNGYPDAQFDGEWGDVLGGSYGGNMYAQYIAKVNARMAIQTDFDISISGSHSGDNYNVTVTVTKVADYSGGTLKVRLALTESNIQYNWQGMNKLDFVNRLMVPDANGTTVDFTSGDTQNVDLSFTFDNSWDINECELVAFIQDDGNKYNQHAAKVMLTDLGGGGGGFQAGFYCDDTTFCGAPAVAHFYDNCSGGDPISWNWYFEGGIPETSLDENPVVTYLNEGDFDVQLIVSDGTDIDTLLMENYIHVNAIPTVYWNDVPALCNKGDDPYTLTEGQPDGGEYSGDFVSDGEYFHPTAAGVGEHLVTYTYTDTDGCENSADYTITVDNCTGIGENQAVGLELFPNPTTGILNINISADEFNNAELKVVNVLGKEIYKQTGLNIKGDYSVRVNLSTQPNGIYFVMINGENQTITRKVFLNK